jgi:hypothetical protein
MTPSGAGNVMDTSQAACEYQAKSSSYPSTIDEKMYQMLYSDGSET